MLPPHIQCYADLVTSHSTVREGFLQQALTKTRQASPFVEEATELAAALRSVKDIDALAIVKISGIQQSLLAAAGFSDKARGHLTQEELQASLKTILERIAEENAINWRDELVYRFLLTRGDTLGGKMRNITGAAGGARLSGAIVEALAQQAIEATVVQAPKNPSKIIAIAWEGRRLVFDKKPSFLNKNIDAILSDVDGHVIACGELKGGIDPAGADEHWKTARSAFDRILEQFPSNPPHLFFIGAAIESSMASEIFTRLQSGRLEYAANLTVAQQVSDLAHWLISL